MTRFLLALAVVMFFVPTSYGEPSTTQRARPQSTQPALSTRPAATVSPDAAAVLTKLAQAYSGLKSLDLAGKITGEFDVDGQKDKQEADFTSSFAAPNRFRHDVTNDAVVGSTGEKLYIYVKNRRLYSMSDAPKDKVPAKDLPDPYDKLLAPDQSHNPSLALALADDPAGELKHSYTRIAKADDVKLEDDKTYTVLKLSKEPAEGKSLAPMTTLLIDPSSNLVRRVLIDMTSNVLADGASDVKKALLTIDYTMSKSDQPAKPDAFAWAPPPGSKDADEVAADDSDNEAAKALLGKPAPEFKLKDLDGKEVALKDLKGSVVVLDFWATWCGPCVASLPHIDQLYKDKKGDGLQVFAVNQSEEGQLVQGFVKSKNLTLPVLLDSDSKVGNKYKANAIPETVVIGKDGVVRKVFVGAGPTTEKELREAVDAAMKAAK